MNDRNLMENILLLEKGACDLFMHGALESETTNVQQTFSTALNESLCMQGSVYGKMSAKGWYPSEQVEQNKVNTVKQKFNAQG
jgi:spore coat protein CotF